jgi:hypothetical protein
VYIFIVIHLGVAADDGGWVWLILQGMTEQRDTKLLAELKPVNRHLDEDEPLLSEDD